MTWVTGLIVVTVAVERVVVVVVGVEMVFVVVVVLVALETKDITTVSHRL